jgi:hypothetical protein
MSCWAFGDVLSKCSPTRKSQTAEAVKVKAWVGNDEDEEDCMLKNVNWGCCGVYDARLGPDRLWNVDNLNAGVRNVGSTIQFGIGNTHIQCGGYTRTRDGYGNITRRDCYTDFKEDMDDLSTTDCREHEESFNQCKSFLGFGMSVLAGQSDQKVSFGSNCYWKPSTRPQFGTLGSAGGGADVLWYNNAGPLTPGIYSRKDSKHNNWINTPGYHFSPDIKPVQLPTNSKVIWERRTSDGSSRFVVDVDRPKTCPNLGKKPPVINDSSCGLSGIAECTYDQDAIVGSCADRECVKSSLDTFITQARTMLKPTPQAAKSALVEWYEMDKEPDYTVLEKAQMINRNRGLAFLVQGAAEVGKCGEVGRSCMAKLNTADCATISRFATEVQQESGTLYSALKRLSNVCYAEAV